MNARRSLSEALSARNLRLEPEPAAPAKPDPVQSRRPPSRRGLKSVAVYLPPEAHRQLRQLSLDEDRSLQELAVEAFDDLFQKRGKPRIARSP